MKKQISIILTAMMLATMPTVTFAEEEINNFEEASIEVGTPIEAVLDDGADIDTEMSIGDVENLEDEVIAVEEIVDVDEVIDTEEGYELNSGYMSEEMDGYEATEIAAVSEPSYMFDYTYYANKYPDLYKAFGHNKKKLYNHWLTYGKREGRSPCAIYDPECYLNNNQDLRNAFGTNYVKLYNHFLTYGIYEFRKSSPIYDGGYYKNHYSDLQNAFGSNSKSYLEHFLNYGAKEGRQASAEFNVYDYKNRYSDLRNAFGNNLKRYYWHYMEYGVREGRNGSPTGNNSPATVQNNTTNTSNTTSNGRNAWVVTSGSRLNMRSSKSTSSAIVCKIPNGSRITVYGNSSNGFYQAEYNGKTGYVSSSYVSFSQGSSNNNNTGGSGLLNSNLSRVSLIKQASKTCKATAVAQSLNLIIGSNKYSTSSMGNRSCKNINGKTYTGSDNNKYVATYKTDSYKGSAAEQKNQIDKAISAGLPIVVTVHKTGSGTKHHWVTIIGKSGSTYKIIDPATGSIRTMSGAGYALGLADYSNGLHYGYVSFSRK